MTTGTLVDPSANLISHCTSSTDCPAEPTYKGAEKNAKHAINIEVNNKIFV
jgi:hypothetical protein